MGACQGTLLWDGEGAERGILICGVIRPLSSPVLGHAGQLGWSSPTPHTLASRTLAQDAHTTDHAEMVVNGKLGWRGLWVGGWEGSCLRQGGPMSAAALHRDSWSPLARTKGDRSLCSSAISPRPQVLAPWGQQWGSPLWQQGREDRLRAGGCSLPLPAPVTLLPARERTLCGACRGCAPQASSPNSPSRCRTQPHGPAAPCMYSYLHMYRVFSRWEPPCPSGCQVTLKRWGQKAIMLCQPLTNTPLGLKHHSPCPQPFPCVAQWSLGLGRTG